MAKKGRGRPSREATTAGSPRAARAFLSRLVGASATAEGIGRLRDVLEWVQGETLETAWCRLAEALNGPEIQRVLDLAHRALAHPSMTIAGGAVALLRLEASPFGVDAINTIPTIEAWEESTMWAQTCASQLASNLSAARIWSGPSANKRLVQHAVYSEVRAWLDDSGVTAQRASIGAHLELAAGIRPDDVWSDRRARWLAALRRNGRDPSTVRRLRRRTVDSRQMPSRERRELLAQRENVSQESERLQMLLISDLVRDALRKDD